jgi:hypothetical protein
LSEQVDQAVEVAAEQVAEWREADEAAVERGDLLRRERGGWPPVDGMGKIVPHGLTWVTYLRGMPWLIEYFDQQVPPAFWAEDVSDEGEPIVLVSCPCGEEPQVRPATCVECACERFYFAVGGRVLVAKPEHVAAGLPATAVEESE